MFSYDICVNVYEYKQIIIRKTIISMYFKLINNTFKTCNCKCYIILFKFVCIKCMKYFSTFTLFGVSNY